MVGIAGSGGPAAVYRRKIPPEYSPRPQEFPQEYSPRGEPEDYPEKDWEDGTGHHRRYDCRFHGWKSEDTIKYHLATLQARKIILHIGPDNGGHRKVLIKK